MKGPDDVVITAAKRTAIGKFLGVHKEKTGVDLGVLALQAALEGVKPESVDQVILGNARGAGLGPNPARQVAIRAGVPHDRPAFTVNQACASGLKAIVLASEQIRLGEADLVAAGGTESMSNVPFLLPRFREGYRQGDAEVVDGMYKDGFLCPMAKKVMGATAETLAERLGIPREEQDAYAAESQRRCEEARKHDRFAAELIAGTDECPRDGVVAEKLAKLPPVFKKTGTVSAGNSSGIADGAAFVLVARRKAAERLGLPVLARLEASATVGVDPEIMGIGPVPAVRKLLEKTGRKLDEFDLVELNEAFAAQVLACLKDLPIDRARLNVWGGSIALGHPIGCTGTRIVATLLDQMKQLDARRGLATLCVSGGLGIAASFERE
ncbi:MAG TPA: thiolase family protein [Planctomycetota bacterium]|nr:thiolase family protein [Planctomycetota bacterium]